MEIIIRDLRQKEKYQIDDAYLNGYAKLCGIYATGVYNCLCRHADYHTQKCFPSIEIMADKLGISVNSVKRGLANLEEWGIILKERTRHPENAKWINNSYILVDKSMWKLKPSHSPIRAMDINESHSPVVTEPQPCRDKSHSPIGASKESHVKDTHIKDCASPCDAREFSFEKELEELKKGGKNGKRKDFKIIALYWKRKDFIFENREQFNSALKRELRAAKNLMGYTGEQIARSIAFCQNKYPEAWTLETCFKRITDIVNVKQNG